MDKQLRDIAEFHHRFNQAYDGAPRLLETALAAFRIKFLTEELSELSDALANDGLETANRAIRLHLALDALIDLDYVLKGTVHLMGFASIYDEAWNRVHAANMQKIPSSTANPGKRASTWDIVKPPGWVEPQFHDLLARAAAEKR